LLLEAASVSSSLNPDAEFPATPAGLSRESQGRFFSRFPRRAGELFGWGDEVWSFSLFPPAMFST